MDLNEKLCLYGKTTIEKNHNLLNKTQSQTISKAPTKGKWKRRTESKLLIRSQAQKFWHWTHWSAAFPSQMTSLKSREFSLRSQIRFLSKKRKDAQCFGQVPDHCSHYQVLPNSALKFRTRICKSKVQKEREEEIKFSLLPEAVLFGCWVAKQLPNKLRGRKGNQPSSQAALTDAEVKGKAQGNSTESIKAGKQLPAFQAALLLVQPSHAPSSSALGSIFLGYSEVSHPWSCEQIEFPQVERALRISLNIQISLLW